MRKSYSGKTIRIYTDDKHYYSVIPEKEFRELNEKGYTRKKARELGIGSKLWNNSYQLYYNSDKVRTDKIRTTNSINRYNQWRDSLEKLENISPGINAMVKNNLRDNPEIIMDELERLSDLFFEMKLFIRQSKKYIKQACQRKGVEYKKMVANASEYQLKKLLVQLGYKPIVQPYIQKYWFDFQVGDTLIELDGEIYHNKERDSIKNGVAKKHGYNLVRIKTTELKNKEKLKKKLKQCLKPTE